MRKEHENRIDPNKPALIVLYGATKRKCRLLTGPITVLGRNPGCDVGIVSPEVAPVHCVIVRLESGWRIRDCSGRATRVNGKTIQDEPLNNGDVIQIGTFSFEAHLPPLPAPSIAPAEETPAAPLILSPPPAAPAVRAEHLNASRRRLAELALGLRRRLRESHDRERDLAQREQDLELLERRLRAASQDRPPRQAENAEAQKRLAEQAEVQKRLDLRRAELEHYARHLRRQQQRLREQEKKQIEQVEAERAAYEADLVQERIELDKHRREVADFRRQIEQRHVEVEQTAAALEEELSREKEQLESNREQVLREREYLDEQRQELIQMRAELERKAGEHRPIVPEAEQDTQLDEPMPDRLASARRLLHQLAERRRALAQNQGK
jgi:hypothetical protein